MALGLGTRRNGQLSRREDSRRFMNPDGRAKVQDSLGGSFAASRTIRKALWPASLLLGLFCFGFFFSRRRASLFPITDRLP